MKPCPQIRPATAHRPDPIETLLDALTEYEIARALADCKHPDNEGARLIAAHKFSKVKTALAELNGRSSR